VTLGENAVNNCMILSLETPESLSRRSSLPRFGIIIGRGSSRVSRASPTSQRGDACTQPRSGSLPPRTAAVPRAAAAHSRQHGFAGNGCDIQQGSERKQGPSTFRSSCDLLSNSVSLCHNYCAALGLAFWVPVGAVPGCYIRADRPTGPCSSREQGRC